MLFNHYVVVGVFDLMTKNKLDLQLGSHESEASFETKSVQKRRFWFSSRTVINLCNKVGLVFNCFALVNTLIINLDHLEMQLDTRSME